ncbi:hypothetical protein ACRAWF_19705 [Streptomyces sp. L7]
MIRADLVPSFGRIALQDLRPRHITAWQEAELARGRERTTVYWIGATLSSALGAAVRSRLIADNPCRYAMTPRPAAQERICWNPTQQAAFLQAQPHPLRQPGRGPVRAAAGYRHAPWRGPRPALDRCPPAREDPAGAVEPHGRQQQPALPRPPRKPRRAGTG